jgi:acyl-coenzyme A thioesterase PaaI-like protein
MQIFEPLNPNYKEDLEQGFASQRVMEAIGVYLISVEPGQVEIGLNFREDLTQQRGSEARVRDGAILFPTGEH